MKIWSWTFMIKEIMRQTYFRKYLGNGRVTSQIEMGTISSINEAEEETRLWEPFGPSWFNLIHKKASTGLGVCILPPKGDQTVGTFLVVKLFSDSEDKSKYYISADQNPLIGNAVHKNGVTYLKIAETNTTGWLRETVNCNLSLSKSLTELKSAKNHLCCAALVAPSPILCSIVMLTFHAWRLALLPFIGTQYCDSFHNMLCVLHLW